MTGKVGIKDVARLAGVSPGTVSKVLKNYPGLSEETRRKVMTVVEEIGFIPNTVASALSTKMNNRIAIYVFLSDRLRQIDGISMLYVLGAFEEARKQHLELVTVLNALLEDLSNEETVRYFHSIHAPTVIVLGSKRDEKIHYMAKEGSLKMVIVDGPETREHISTVTIDQAKAQYETADRICQPGDKVLYLKGLDDHYATELRLSGMEKLAADKHLDLRIEEGDYSEDKAYETVKSLLDQEFDDIVCASDLMAIGAKRALPKGSPVRLAGFDGIRLMEYVADDVITCRQDFYQIGSEAVKAAARLSQGGKGEQVVVPYSVTTIHR